MKSFAFFILLWIYSLCDSSAQIEYNLYFNGDIKNWLSTKEIKDSGFSHALVMVQNKGREAWDTSHVYEFSGDKLVREIGYSNGIAVLDYKIVFEEGKKKVYIKETYPYFDQELTVEEYDSVGLLRQTTNFAINGEVLSVRKYTYEGHRLICSENQMEGHDTISYKFFYNIQGDLIKIIEHNFQYQVTDSVLVNIWYNDKEHIVFYCKRPSPTYMKNMRKWCATGLVETYRIEYDSLGRIAKETFDLDTLISIDQSRSYATYLYGKGIVQKTLHSYGEDKYFFQSYQRNGKVLLITENREAMRIEYISEKSELPQRFEVLSDIESANYRVYWKR